MMMGKKALLLLLTLLLLAQARLWAKDYLIRSAAELAVINLKPGDKVIMQQDGDWRNQQMVFKGRGTKEAPITLCTAEAGQVHLEGNSNLLIDGQFLVVDGLSFIEGSSLKNDVILFSKNCEWCRLTNTSIVDYNSADKTQDYKWVSLNGFHNRVDHCYIKGKSHQGTTLVVWVADKPNYHQIDHNFFDYRPELGANGGETIRIGTSTVSQNDSYTTVEDNIFYRCDGEMEVLSNKSCHNIVRNNLFYECVGTLTLRHGNYASVYGNYLIGNHVKGTGGIRIIGENHRVYHNYLQGLTGDGMKAAINLMDGLPNSPLNGYWQVKNPEVVGNTIVDCKEAFNIGSGKNEVRILPPVNVLLADNVVYNSATINFSDQPQGIIYKGNMYFKESAVSEAVPDGFSSGPLKLKPDDQGVFQADTNSRIKNAFQGNFSYIQSKDAGVPPMSAGQSALFKDRGIGPGWLKLERDLSVKAILK